MDWPEKKQKLAFKVFFKLLTLVKMITTQPQRRRISVSVVVKKQKRKKKKNNLQTHEWSSTAPSHQGLL